MNKYFESSYLTWEIIPNKNLQFILDTFKHLEYLEENERYTWKHTETSDYYFKQRPIGGERPFSVWGLNILTSELQTILSSHDLILDEKNEFVKDQEMHDYRKEIHNAISFSNPSYAIFFSSENGIVKHIWFDYEDHLSIESDRFKICDLLNFLGEKYSFILIDWYEKFIIDLSSKEKTIQFLNDTAASNDLV